MPKAIKRKVRRKSNWVFSTEVSASIIGQSPLAMHRFQLLDVGDPIPFPDIERDVYLRVCDSVLEHHR
jgi:hypothetical protein